MKKLLLSLYILSLSALLWGQKKIEFGIHLGIFTGVNPERASTNSGGDIFFPNPSDNILNKQLTSKIGATPSILAGIILATPLDKKGNQFRTGIDLHTFQYDLSSLLLNPSKIGGFTNNATTLQSQVFQIPIHYTKHWGGFLVSLGSGLSFFTLKDISTTKEKAQYSTAHIDVINRTTKDMFKKVYPFYDISAGWRWKKTTIELSYRVSGELRKGNSNSPFADYFGNRNFLCIGSTFFL
jgi:hypothetical protein